MLCYTLLGLGRMISAQKAMLCLGSHFSKESTLGVQPTRLLLGRSSLAFRAACQSSFSLEAQPTHHRTREQLSLSVLIQYTDMCPLTAE